jgi:hypothetical protein
VKGSHKAKQAQNHAKTPKIKKLKKKTHGRWEGGKFQKFVSFIK